jgi:hypothetical protein
MRAEKMESRDAMGHASQNCAANGTVDADHRVP